METVVEKLFQLVALVVDLRMTVLPAADLVALRGLELLGKETKVVLVLTTVMVQVAVAVALVELVTTRLVTTSAVMAELVEPLY